jgi:hypothetical protein
MSTGTVYTVPVPSIVSYQLMPAILGTYCARPTQDATARTSRRQP